MNKGIDRESSSKTLCDVKSFENINKNPEFSRDKYCSKGSP